MSQEENHEVEEDVDSKNRDKRSAKHDSGAADLERVTNYAEEKEIKSDANFISVIHDVKKQDETTRVTREQELLKISIKKEDVELIMKELEIPKIKAERALREHRGDLIETLVTLTN